MILTELGMFPALRSMFQEIFLDQGLNYPTAFNVAEGFDLQHMESLAQKLTRSERESFATGNLDEEILPLVKAKGLEELHEFCDECYHIMF